MSRAEFDFLETSSSAGGTVAPPALHRRRARLLLAPCAGSPNRPHWLWALRYGMAVVAVAAGFALRMAFTAWMGPGLPTYITFYPAVMVAAMLGGLGPGLLATALSGLLAAYWILPPEGFAIGSPVEHLGLVLFAGMGLFMSAVAELYGRNRHKATQGVRAERQRFNHVLDMLPSYVVLLTPDYRVPFANRFFEERFGKSLGKRCYEYLFQRTEPCENCETYKVLKTGAPHRWEWTGPDGRNYDIYDFPFADADGSPLIMEVGIDITEMNRAGAALQEANETLEQRVADRTAELRREVEERRRTEEDWEQTFNSVPDYVAILDNQHRVVRANRAMAERLGVTPEQCVGVHCYRAVHGSTEPPESCPHAHTCRDGREHTAEVYEARLGGHFLVTTTPRFDEQGRVIGAVHIARDITHLKRAEDALRASLREKEVLLKEIHHRVKNNMQVISSLVSLQADGLQDPALRGTLQDVRDRVRSMALVHEKLYQSSSLARIEFAEYARSLLNYLWRAHGSVAAHVRLTLDLQPIPLSVETAVPCGLILNELAGNALKHAFSKWDPDTPRRGDAERGERENGGGCEVKVALGAASDGRVTLRVSDNGSGLPAGVDWRESRSLGLRLVQMLSSQIGASVEVSTHEGEGTQFEVTFHN